MWYSRLADAVLVLHFAVVIFVVGGLFAIVWVNVAAKQWPAGWVNSWFFRWAHAVAIVVITLQAWLGQYCPLTLLESWLRRQAGQDQYSISFVQYWLARWLYFEAPLWVFAVLYTLFALIVALVWWRYPPRPLPWRQRKH